MSIITMTATAASASPTVRKQRSAGSFGAAFELGTGMCGNAARGAAFDARSGAGRIFAPLAPAAVHGITLPRAVVTPHPPRGVPADD